MNGEDDEYDEESEWDGDDPPCSSSSRSRRSSSTSKGLSSYLWPDTARCNRVVEVKYGDLTFLVPSGALDEKRWEKAVSKAVGCSASSLLQFVTGAYWRAGWSFCQDWGVLIELHRGHPDPFVDELKCNLTAAILRHRQWVNGFVEDHHSVDFNGILRSCRSTPFAEAHYEDALKAVCEGSVDRNELTAMLNGMERAADPAMAAREEQEKGAVKRKREEESKEEMPPKKVELTNVREEVAAPMAALGEEEAEWGEEVKDEWTDELLNTDSPLIKKPDQDQARYLHYLELYHRRSHSIPARVDTARPLIDEMTKRVFLYDREYHILTVDTVSEDGSVYLKVKQAGVSKRVLEERLRQDPRTRQAYARWREQDAERAKKEMNREAKLKPVVLD
jgi:hypothetical protein